MPARNYYLYMLCGVILAINGLILSAAEAPSVPIPAHVTEGSADDSSTDQERLEFRFRICEVRGDIQSLPPTAGFTATPSGIMRLKAKSVTPRNPNNQSQSQMLIRRLAESIKVNVLTAPTVVMTATAHAEIQIGQLAPLGEYLVHEGDNRYERRTEPAGNLTGTTIDMAPSLPDQQRRCAIQLKITSTEMDGRAPVAGLNLDVGEPMVTSRTLETTVYQTIGQETDAMIWTLSPERHLLVVFESLQADAG